jgi:hypothetical protein
MLDILLGILRNVEGERLIAHLGEMVVSCSYGLHSLVSSGPASAASS